VTNVRLEVVKTRGSEHPPLATLAHAQYLREIHYL